ncbi:hypothetical protein BD408DRAFT_352019 [Parasitella parasitica]|nr:hypothetical protein BD408DRAFT_352019 [Parasitella parasitica]
MSPSPSKKRKTSVSIAPLQPAPVALPPPLIPYPPPHLMHPYYPVSPQLHPTATASVPNVPAVSPMFFGTRNGSITSTVSNSTADQREQARKISHSAIERRRREKINDKILQLRDLIPSCAERENLHKMTILQSAIDYITYLKKVIEDSPTLTEDQHSLSKQPPKEAVQNTNQKPCASETATAAPNKPLSPPEIIIGDSQEEEPEEAASLAHSERNMNLENILC